MKKIGKLMAGGLVGIALTVAAGGVAQAAPLTASTGTPAATTASTVPPNAPDKKVLTGGEIWRIVEPHHPIYCKQAAQELRRARVASTAAARRLVYAQARSAAIEKSHRKNRAKAIKASQATMKGFQKLERLGQARIARITTKCHV